MPERIHNRRDETEIDTAAGLTRRCFLRGVSMSALCLASLGLPVCTRAEGDNINGTDGVEDISGPTRGYIEAVESPYYMPLSNDRVMCLLCPRGCMVEDGNRGYCEVRENRGGAYYSLVYANPCAVHVDPIEKKPLFHVLPATSSFSIATAGCNLTCKFCQNFEISQALPEDTINYRLTPKTLAKLAGDYLCRSVAYTYVEPTIFYEYMVECAKEVKAAGLVNVMHSNGYINPTPRGELAKYLTAANIDLKGFSDSFYTEMTEGTLAPVLDSIAGYRKAGVHVEITNLVIPTKNDDMAMIRDMARWIKEDVGADTPLHFSRFHPMYQLKNVPNTPLETLLEAHAAAKEEGLEYVYIGNVPGNKYESTYCPDCGEMIIFRAGYFVGEVKIDEEACRFCGYPISGVWEMPGA